MIDENEVDELRRQRRREPKCQCEGEVVGPCPGPLVCPNSGLVPDEEEENKMDMQQLKALKEEYLLTLDDDDEFDGLATARGWASNELNAFFAWLAERGVA